MVYKVDIQIVFDFHLYLVIQPNQIDINPNQIVALIFYLIYFVVFNFISKPIKPKNN